MLQVSRQSVHELIARAVIERGVDGLVDVEMAKIAIANRVRPSAKTAAKMQPPTGDTSPTSSAPPAIPDDGAATSYHVAKTLREVAEARLAQLRLGEMRGELIRLAAVKTALGIAFATAREYLLQLPSRLAPQLAGESDPATIQNLLHAEIHQALVDLSGAGDRIGQTEPVPE